jgi:tetratricopeptide (TPR) repeat protein
MSDHQAGRDTNVVPAGRRELTSNAASNPLVARGLADLAEATAAGKRIQASAIALQNAISHYLSGTGCYQKDDYTKAVQELDEAISLLNDSIRLDPSNAVAYRHRGKAWWWKNAAEEMMDRTEQPPNEQDCDGNAMNDFDQAILLDPTNPIGYIERAEAQCWGHSFEKGLEDFNQAIRLDPNNPAWYALRGCVRLDDLDNRKAIQDFNEAMRLNAPTQPEILIVFTPRDGRTPLQGEDGDFDGSGNPTWREFVRLDLLTIVAPAYRRRGFRRLREEEYDRAIQACAEAIRLNGQNARAFAMRGQVWFDKEEYDKAIEDFGEVIRLDPDNTSAYERRGAAWLRKACYDAAIRDFDEVIRLAPDEAFGYYNRGGARYGRKEYDQAIKDLDEAIRLSPVPWMIYFISPWAIRGDASAAKRDYDKAIQDYNRAIGDYQLFAAAAHGADKDGLRRSETAQVYFDRGKAWAAKQDYEKAIQDYSEAIRLDPSRAVFFNNRGIAWFRRVDSDREEVRDKEEDCDKAIEDFSEAIRLDPAYAVYFDNRAQAWSLYDFDKALDDYNEAIRLDPENDERKITRDWAIKHFEDVVERRKERLEKLRQLKAPQLIIQSSRERLATLEAIRGRVPRTRAE